MKKIHLIFVALFVLTIATVLAFSPLKSSDKLQLTQTCTSIPGDVAKILQNSCTDCHGTGGEKMAVAMWSITSWDNYSIKKQIKKAKAICKAISNGSMPPREVRQTQPERIPTTAQIEIICKWASSVEESNMW